MDRLEAMAILIEVIEAGSLSAASRKLGIPLPTVSRKIGDLEAHLRTRLLYRTTRQLSLTEAGATYVASCRRILEEVSEAERMATGEYASPKGHLVITAPIVFGRLHVVPVLAEFLAAFPQIDVRLNLTDRSIHLLEEHIDVAVRVGELPDSAQVAVNIGQLRLVTCASPGYLANRGAPKKPDDLQRHDCIGFEGLASSRAWSFPSRKGDVTVQITPRLVTNTAESALDAAVHDVGIARLLSYQVEAAVREKKLCVLLEKFEPPRLPVHLLHAGQQPVPLKLRAFMDFARPRLQERLARP